MPNWCFNQIDVKGDEQEIQKLIALIESSKTEKDKFNLFSKICPMPPHIKATLGGAIANDFDLEREPTDWYFWRLKYWGTKWEADGIDYELVDKNSLKICFYTAWNPSLPITYKLSELFPRLSLTHRYYEFGYLFVGTGRFESGKIISHQHDRASKETMAQHGLETNYFEVMESDVESVQEIYINIKETGNK